MKNLFILFLASWFLVPGSFASPVSSLFGTSSFTPNRRHTVTGPLVQFTTAGGSTLSFQQGSQFSIDDTGTITLTQGNLRIGPAGTQALTVNLPQGAVTVAPLTALTVTAQPEQTTGRIYQGNLNAEGRTFTTGEGFILTPSGAHGTFTPAAALAPALTSLASIEPAAGPAQLQTPPTSPNQQPVRIRPLPAIQPVPSSQPEQPAPEQPATENPPAPEPVPEIPPTYTPPADTPPADNPPADTPPVDIPPVDNPPLPEPDPEPIADPEPTTLQRTNLLAAWSLDTSQPLLTARNTNTGILTLSEYADGTQTLTELQNRSFRTTTSLNIGTAENLDATSHGPTSGLGRWVGGELTAVTTGAAPVAIANSMATNTPNSLHYVWGEKPTAIPTSGHVEYTLTAATQPTYVTQPGAPALSSAGATFAGNLAIDFNPGFSGVLGTYHLTGTVTMPQVTQTAPQTETEPTITPVTYNLSTPAEGVPLTAIFNNTGTLNVTAPTNALACPGTCTGTVNAAGFGAGMKDAGALYAINPTAPTSITGAAIFTATP